MSNEKIMGFDHALVDIDKQIEELYAKRAEIENRMEQARKESEEKRKAEREKAYQEIKELINNYNNKYDSDLIVVNANELYAWGLII